MPHSESSAFFFFSVFVFLFFFNRAATRHWGDWSVGRKYGSVLPSGQMACGQKAPVRNVLEAGV